MAILCSTSKSTFTNKLQIPYSRSQHSLNVKHNNRPGSLVSLVAINDSHVQELLEDLCVHWKGLLHPLVVVVHTLLSHLVVPGETLQVPQNKPAFIIIAVVRLLRVEKVPRRNGEIIGE